MEPLIEHVLFVHAHPDDETITTGGTIATLIDSGVAVTVVTCTRGELGEVIPADLSYLEGSAGLGDYRANELATALDILGVTDRRFLGDTHARRAGLKPRRYTDSGMQWGENGAVPAETLASDAFCSADFREIVSDLATVIDAVKPTAVISYDSTGGYGHPDHVRAHLVAQRATEMMNVPFFVIGIGDIDSVDIDSIDNDSIDVDVAAVLDRKRDALHAHRTQVTVDGDQFFLSSGPARPIATTESFRRSDIEQSGAVAWKDQGFGIHFLAWLLAFVVGIIVGGVSVVNHQYAPLLFGRPIPVGITLALLIIVALLVGLRIVFPGRLVIGLAATGLLAVIGLLSVASTGGSVLVPANLAGYVLTYGSLVITMLVLAWPKSGTFSRDRLVTRSQSRMPESNAIAPESKGTTRP